MSESEQERRKSSRYNPVRNEVWLGWEGPLGFQSARVQVVNISFGGLALLGAASLPESGAFWVKLYDADKLPWAAVSVVGRDGVESGTPILRLQFIDECPYDFYRAAVFGFADEAAAPVAEVPAAPAAPPAPREAAPAWPFGATTPAEPGEADRGQLRDAFSRQRRFFRGG